MSAVGADRRNNFDFIRMAAATAVLVGHSYPLWGGVPDPLQESMDGATTLGEVAVAVFFVISGYLVCESWLSDPNALRYLARRALRLLPALYLTILLSVFVAGPLLTSLTQREYWSSPLTWRYLGGLGVFWMQGSLPGVFEDSFYPLAFNGPLWTLRVETACYLALLGLGALGVLRSPALTILVAAACIAINLALPERANVGAFLYTPYEPLSRLAGLFFSGAVLYQYREVVPRVVSLAVALLAALFLLGATPYYRLAFHLLFPYVVVCLAFAPVPGLARFGRFGDFSYGTYLYAWPVQQAVMSTWGYLLTLWGYILVSLGITLVLAVLSWHLVEKRALALKPRARRLK